ncbi:MAG: DUF3857 domain-containing protein [Bacteroidota bacterium]
MVKKYVCIAAVFFTALSCSSTAPKFVTDYPINGNVLGYMISGGVNTIVRSSVMNVEIQSERTATVTTQRAVTILNEDGRDEGEVVLYYDTFKQVKNLSGYVIDRTGKVVYSSKKDDILDFPATSSYSLYEDNRVKILDLNHYEYPYTIVYSYEESYDGLLNVPNWYIQQTDQLIEYGELTVRHPKGLPLKYYEQNFDGAFSSSEEAGIMQKTWVVEELKPIDLVKYSKPFSLQQPRVLLATERFQMDESVGKMGTWEDFGAWYHELSKGRDELTEETKREVDEVIQGVDSDTEKVALLYDYMQKKTRYVSIQLGIGGWQTFPASFVEETGYGDCKALTNFMASILKYAGLEAYPALIRSGRFVPPIVEDFPSSQFNHVVLHVPAEEDSLWLECTHQGLPFNYIGFSNTDRKALLIKEEGSYLIDTPVFDERINTLVNVNRIHISDSDTDIKVETQVNGYFYDQYLSALSLKNKDDRERWIRLQADLSDIHIESYDFEHILKKENPLNLSYHITSDSYTSKTGSRVFVPVNRFNSWGANVFIPEDSTRTEDIELLVTFSEQDSTIISYEPFYDVEFLPEDVHVSEDFGELKINLKHNPEQKTIVVYRSMVLNKSVIPYQQYEELRAFFGTLIAADKRNIVLRQIQASR